MTAGPQTLPIDQVVDWDLAIRTASLVARPGPQVSWTEAAEVVEQLRSAAAQAVPHVAEVTELSAPEAGGPLVVDRPGWAKANVAGFRGVLAPVVAASFNRRDRGPSPATTAVGARLTGAEVGSLLGILSTRVLGQYDAFGEGPRLLLWRPTSSRSSGSWGGPADFRLWVCLHEGAHGCSSARRVAGRPPARGDP
jgi:putative hydrolase